MPASVYTPRIELSYGEPVDARFTETGERVSFGLHGPLAEHHEVEDDGTAATLDYLTAAVGGCMVGTFGDALRKRGLAFSSLTARAEGAVRPRGSVLVLERVRVTYRLSAGAEAKSEIERVHAVHARACPVHRSLEGGLAIESALEISEG